MQACLVILLAVMSVGPLSGIQLDLGRILQVLLGAEPKTRRILEDYPGCGELGTKRVFRKNDINKLDNSCMKTCQWKPNPFFKAFFPWELYNKNNANECLNIEVVRVFITAPNVPTDLNCLEDCFSDITYTKLYLNPLGQEDPFFEPFDLMYNKSTKPFDYNLRNMTCCGDRGISIFDDSLNNLLDFLMKDNMGLSTTSQRLNNFLENPEVNEVDEVDEGDEGDEVDVMDSSLFRQKTRESFPIPCKGPQEQTPIENDLRAVNSQQLAIEICAFAKLFAAFNRKYSVPSGFTFLFQNQTCDAIIKVNPPTTFDQNPEPLFHSKHRKKNKRKKNKRKKNKVFGSTSKTSEQNTHPWLCALKEKGFDGRHRCGVTLLSGPPDPILVSAAHCNYVCKDNRTMELQEICCCRETSEISSCRKDSSYCTKNAQLTKADISEMQIVCGEHSLVVQPEAFSEETEVVLDILEIINHKDYSPGEPGKLEGPYLGSDIAVYKVNATNFFHENDTSKLEKKKLYPACLPKSKETYSNALKRGIFAAWSDPEPLYRVNNDTSLELYTLNYYYPRQAIMEEVACKDPDWMQSKTYFPPGTVCYRDPAFASCVQFGNSGASIVREFENADGKKRYSMAGPLSMSKGCDLAWIEGNSITYASENPNVFTDAYCYLDWIAEQYDMSVPDSYQKPDSCKKPRGNINDIDKSFCRARGHIYGVNTGVDIFGADIDTYCHFNQMDDEGKPFDKCRLIASEGFAYNIFQCKDGRNNSVLCANNCKGVDPNAVVIGGSAVLAATAAASVGFLMPAIFGFGGIALAGGSTIVNEMCPIGWCNVPRVGRCCMIQLVRRRLRCPSRC